MQDWGLKTDLEALAEAIREARAEWWAAQRFFAEVTEPDLVDQAIYRLEAAERKYMYLWKLARNRQQKDDLQL
ncbi:YaaL family protein [Moorella sulfitireducens (nom. illeg.)]|uniref:YaaL family protein n=1 Tax=Neomoorella sulfitireducens TaxID=2972948 RepID=UPI0021AC60C7|nr:YaaL family protein [Moorella sulfitireducens]